MALEQQGCGTNAARRSDARRQRPVQHGPVRPRRPCCCANAALAARESGQHAGIRPRRASKPPTSRLRPPVRRTRRRDRRACRPRRSARPAAQALREAEKAIARADDITARAAAAYADDTGLGRARRCGRGAAERDAGGRARAAEHLLRELAGHTRPDLFVTPRGPPLVPSVSPDMSIRCGHRPYHGLSKSERWRIDALLGAAVASLSGHRLLVLDEADMLQPEPTTGAARVAGRDGESWPRRNRARDGHDERAVQGSRRMWRSTGCRRRSRLQHDRPATLASPPATPGVYVDQPRVCAAGKRRPAQPRSGNPARSIRNRGVAEQLAAGHRQRRRIQAGWRMD